MLLADITATNPGEWAKLASELGPFMTIAMFCLAALVAFILIGGFLIYKLASKNIPVVIDIHRKFLDKIAANSENTSKVLQSQVGLCKVTKTNIQCLCDAGHCFADAVLDIGKGINVDLTDTCDQIHTKLKTVVSTNE